MITIVVSAVVSFLVAYATAKHCLDEIDGYVRDVTAELKSALDGFIRRWNDQKSK